MNDNELFLESLPKGYLNDSIVKLITNLEGQIVDIIAPPFKMSELFAVLESAIGLIGTYPNLSLEDIKTASLTVWEYFNKKYSIIQTLDDLVNVGALLEPFDSMAFELIITKALIPLTANQLKK